MEYTEMRSGFYKCSNKKDVFFLVGFLNNRLQKFIFGIFGGSLALRGLLNGTQDSFQ